VSQASASVSPACHQHARRRPGLARGHLAAPPCHAPRVAAIKRRRTGIAATSGIPNAKSSRSRLGECAGHSKLGKTRHSQRRLQRRVSPRPLRFSSACLIRSICLRCRPRGAPVLGLMRPARLLGLALSASRKPSREFLNAKKSKNHRNEFRNFGAVVCEDYTYAVYTA
jgi:hypothetical protein